ncbi:MAG: low-specificity L-threonine aldolase [Flavobacteriales bacterium]
MTIDLRSDTITRPTAEMKDAMMNAELGDDVFGEDPSIKALEAYAASLLGKEAALFCPSGTMTNQIGINVHTSPGDELICDSTSHTYRFEAGGMAFHSGVSVYPLEGDRGRITADQVKSAIQAPNAHFPKSRLVVLENTHNKGSGSIYDKQEVDAIGRLCQEQGLRFHLDGARLFNAVVASGISAKEWSEPFDSVSICLSKGLGAPVGSVLVGDEDFIREAHRKRKVFGGGMRQAGIIAAGGLYALENHIDRLKEDHRKARKLGEALEQNPQVEEVAPIDTNIVVATLKAGKTPKEQLQDWEKKGVKAVPFGDQQIRLVTHIDVTEKKHEKALELLKG